MELSCGCGSKTGTQNGTMANGISSKICGPAGLIQVAAKCWIVLSGSK